MKYGCSDGLFILLLLLLLHTFITVWVYTDKALVLIQPFPSTMQHYFLMVPSMQITTCKVKDILYIFVVWDILWNTNFIQGKHWTENYQKYLKFDVQLTLSTLGNFTPSLLTLVSWSAVTSPVTAGAICPVSDQTLHCYILQVCGQNVVFFIRNLSLFIPIKWWK